MSYLVLARKYRPRSFEELVGQEHVVQALTNALTQQRLHHAYLFTGTRGVGKTTVSRILAKSLSCVGPDGTGGITATPCGVCHVCRDIDSGRFVDYVELDAASNRGVEEITQLLDQAVYKPVVGRFKVYMVDEVHMLSSHAFNAMLKTLEEPPEYLKFVLATTDPQKVPATVLSRCLQFNLRPIAPPTVQEHLADVLAREQIEAEPGALRLLSRGARGSMRDALSLTDQAIAFGAGKLEEAGVRQMLGAVDRSHVVRILRALVEREGAGLIKAVDGLRTLGLSALGTLDELAAMLQQIAVLQAVPDAADVDDPDAAVTSHLAELMRADEVQLIYSIVLHGRAELGLAPDEYSGLVMILLRMLAFQSADSDAASAPPPAAGGDGAKGAGRIARVATASAALPVMEQAGEATRPAPESSKVTATESVAASAPAARPLARLAPVATSSTPATPDRPAATSSDHRSEGASNDGPRHSVPVALRPERSTLPQASSPAVRHDTRPVLPAIDPAASTLNEMPEPPPWCAAPDGQDASSSDALPESAVMASGAGADPVMAARPAAASKPFSIPRSSTPVPATSAMPSPLVVSPLGDRWASHVKSMVEAGAIGALVRELALQAQCVSVEPHADGPPNGELWRLKVERETLRAKSHCDKLQAALSALLGFPVTLVVDSGATEDSPARRDAAEKARRQSEAEDTIQNDPLVLTLMQQYRTARIVPGSIKFH